ILGCGSCAIGARPYDRDVTNAPSVRTGTVGLASRSTAIATSSANPLSTSSRPEVDSRTAADTSGVATYAARTHAASGEAETDDSDDRAASTAPAPSPSSMDSRSVPSGQRSPAGTTRIGRSGLPYPWASSHRPTADALRRQAARTTPDAAAAIAEPF